MVIPALLLVLSILLVEAHGPYHLAANFDPEYCYLFNSLNILNFHFPAHTDHPGTTLQVFGAAVMLVRWAMHGVISGWRPLTESVLTNPEDYLHSINLALNLLYCGLLYVVARRVQVLTDSLVPALALQVSFLMAAETFLAQTRVSPEPLLLSAALALMWVLLPTVMGYDRQRQASDPRAAVLAGAAFAFGVVTKVTFVPLGFLVLLFPGLRQKARFAAAAVVCSAALLAPIATQIPRLAGWLWALLIHRERYGAGEIGLPSLASWTSHLSALFRAEPFFYLLAGLYAALLLSILVRDDSRSPEMRRLLGASVLAISILVLFTSKHFAPHYTLAAIALVPFVNSSLAERFRSGVPGRAVWAGLGILLVVGGLAATAIRMNAWLALDAFRQESLRRQTGIMRQMEQCAVAGRYRSSLLTHALYFGNRFANLFYTRILEDLYPDAMNYNSDTGWFEDFGRESLNDQVAAALAEGRCVLLQSVFEGADEIRNFRSEPVSEPGWERLVRITGAAFPPRGGELPKTGTP